MGPHAPSFRRTTHPKTRPQMNVGELRRRQTQMNAEGHSDQGVPFESEVAVRGGDFEGCGASGYLFLASRTRAAGGLGLDPRRRYAGRTAASATRDGRRGFVPGRLIIDCM
jgi:hypothetical protein